MSRRQYPTALQKSKLIEYLEADQELRGGKFSANFTKKVSEERWCNIALNLNSLGGANKTWTDWRKTWQDMKSKSKKKQTIIRRSQILTGGGPPVPSLTEHDTLILNTMSDASIVGHADSEESLVCFKDLPDLMISINNNEIVNLPGTSGPVSDIKKEFIQNLPGLSTLRDSTADIVVSDLSNHCTSSPPSIGINVEQFLENVQGLKNNKKKKPIKTKSQTRLEKSLATAAVLVEALKEKNEIKKKYYHSKIKEMKKQTNFLKQIAHSLSRR